MLVETPEHSGELLTIKQMAQQSGLTEHTLRYYERIGLIAPIPRHDSSGHRRYSAETVRLVESLACLRGTGLSLERLQLRLKYLAGKVAYWDAIGTGDSDLALEIAKANQLLVRTLTNKETL